MAAPHQDLTTTPSARRETSQLGRCWTTPRQPFRTACGASSVAASTHASLDGKQERAREPLARILFGEVAGTPRGSTAEARSVSRSGAGSPRVAAAVSRSGLSQRRRSGLSRRRRARPWARPRARRGGARRRRRRASAPRTQTATRVRRKTTARGPTRKRTTGCRRAASTGRGASGPRRRGTRAGTDEAQSSFANTDDPRGSRGAAASARRNIQLAEPEETKTGFIFAASAHAGCLVEILWDGSRRRRGCIVDIPGRGDAAAASRIFRRDGSRRDCLVDIPGCGNAAAASWVAATLRLPRGYSVENGPRRRRGRLSKALAMDTNARTGV